MTPKITDQMAADAIEAGGREKKEIRPPAPAPTPIPEIPSPTDLGPLTGAISELVSNLQEQVNAAQAQLEAAQRHNDELRALAQAILADKPVRLKPVRDMDRESPSYLLVQYYDMIPVQYTRKLDS